MKDFLEYVLEEVKNRRLLKTEAVDLVRQFQEKAAGGKDALLHPLLHKNTSDLSEQRFTSVFTGEEFFLKDHVVQGRRVLPGVAYLEMARAAVEEAAGILKEKNAGMRLKNVVWTRPVVVGEEPVPVHIGLFPAGNGEITYQIYSQPDSSPEENVIHSQGSAAFTSPGKEFFDLEAFKTECSQRILTAAQCYEAFDKLGISYGPGHQGIETLFLGTEKIAAKLNLPFSVTSTREQYILHPSIMDSALQASMGLMLGSGSLKTALPFALQELELFAACTPAMWAVVRYSPGSKAEDKVQKLDIDLCNEQGAVCVRLKGFTARILEEELDAEAKDKPARLLYQPGWKEEQAGLRGTASEYVQHVVMLCELKEGTQEEVEKQLPGVHYLTLQGDEENTGERFTAYTVQVFENIKKILEDKPKGQVLLQLVVPGQKEQQLFSGLSGLLKTAHLENPKLICQIIEVEDTAQLAEKLQAESSMYSIDGHIRYQDGRRWIADWQEIEYTQDTLKIPWKDRGVYLITGGSGGLGLLFAREIARQARSATIILTGRSPLTSEMQEKWQDLDARIEYRQVDVGEPEAVKRLVEGIQEEFDGLQGILHCAGIIRDNFIVKKTREEMQAVLLPKVAGLVNLDQAAREINLDFFILFSSIAGSLGSAGQADYAAANAFMDAYAGYRNELVSQGQRQGKTLSLNWPLWQDGGMGVDEATEKMMMRGMGMIAMQSATGIQALYESLALESGRVMVMEGYPGKMRGKLLAITGPVGVQGKNVPESAANLKGDSGELLEKVQNALMEAVSGLLKVKLADIDVGTELNEYGFDSISFTEFANQLNQDYRMELTPTVFFEYPTIQSFAAYLVQEHNVLLASQFLEPDKAEHPVPISNETEGKLENKKRQPRFRRPAMPLLPDTDTGVKDAIAIVGMSGKFPNAKDLHEFWNNLLAGRDCISEIPGSRWDWREYYGDPAKETNKTNIKWGGFIDGVEEFDPLFFGISPREAELMDPQQRLLMMYVWKVIEDAGYSSHELSGTQTGIFVGTGSSGYDVLISKANIAIEGYTSTGIVPSVGPNRMSYLLNLHGPSEPIETACSSSLVAIHRAVQALESGACEMAIAGGVNTLVNPDLYVSFNKAGMLAEDGRCKTFSDQADGYVRGEGVGMLFLKKLKDAEESGDHIYGIIRGTAENHGGKANSLTAPNPKAQAELLRTAYTKAGIDPRTVTYIEAHGTGTELGDPIEINGLKAAFKALYEAAGAGGVTDSHCGLGSVKTNIGHLELAAGVAGVIKVLLQLQHKTLVKSLHCDRVNPYIQLGDSPFYIVQEKREWKALADEDGRTLPRRGGVSSFGFGGVNAHVVIEEYVPSGYEGETMPVSTQNPALVVLSARNEERLKEQAEQLLNHIAEQGFTNHHLAGIAYTLQVGREAMEERLAVIAGSLPELESKLQGFMSGQEKMEGVYRGQVKRNKDAVALFIADEDLAGAMDAWIHKRKYGKILNLWVKGLAFDWNRIYGAAKPRRISLPTYPFARERYWIPENTLSLPASGTAAIMPLLHRNTSTFSEQRFSSRFTGQEFFLQDYAVRGERIFPEAAYLEMAREAVVEAAALPEGQRSIRLKNILWLQPIAVNQEEIQVHIELIPEENGQIAFEIYSQPESGEEAVIHNQGTAVLSKFPAEDKRLDLAAIQAQCSEMHLDGGPCFEALRGIGIDCGPAYQGIETVYGGAGQALAKLILPSCLLSTQEQLMLHPAMVHAAIFASIGFMMNSGESEIVLSAALQELEVFDFASPAMWAWIRCCESGINGQRFDIDLCDSEGKVCISMKGLEMQRDREAAHAIEEISEKITETSKEQKTIEMMIFEERWQEQALANPTLVEIKTLVCFLSNPENQKVIVEVLRDLSSQTQVLFVSQNPDSQGASSGHYFIVRKDRSTYEQVFQNIRETHGSVDGVLYLWPAEDATCMEEYSVIVYLLQSMAAVKLKAGRILLGAQFITGLEGCYLDSWIGFERSLGLVLPNVPVAVTCQENNGLSQEASMKDWVGRLWAELTAGKMESTFYREGKRYVYRIKETVLETGNSLLEAGGTYLITGGCGGLGFLFARHFASTHKVNLILTGRSALDEKKQAKIRELERLGSQALYIQADSCDASSMKAAVEEAKNRFGAIHGVIHAAGLVSSQTIFEKDMAGFKKIIDPKIKGTLVLDEVLREEALHFICYFSSSSAILGDFGSCDYAIGNRFEMAYGRYRQEKQQRGEVHGKTVVINWPLWKDGGMGVGEEENSKLYLKSSGQRFLEAGEGVAVFDQLLAQRKTQHLVLVGERSRIERFLKLSQESPVVPASTVSNGTRRGRRAEMRGLTLEQCIEWDLKELASQLLKIPRDKLDREENLADFGFDSISLSELAGSLTNHYGIEITPALFFGYSTLEKLTQYFFTAHQDVMQGYYRETVMQEMVQSIPVLSLSSKRQAKKSKLLRKHTVLTGQDQEPIAIIGMSGRFPDARNIEEMWQILAGGQDVIRDFPADRLSGKGKTPYKYGAVPGVSEFDPLFFEISPREAESMDPRQRLLLQESWKALEDAGYGTAKIQKSKIGMFVGVEEGDYRLLLKDKSSITANHNAVLSARLAYFLNLSGPNMAINTACSSGLVAVHQACQSIRSQECDTALAAGVNLLLTPEMFDGMQEAGMLSEDGKCFAFAKRANGMVPAEAVAVVVLKRLSQAKADKDPVYAIIRGSGINYDGKTNGITAPSGVSQTKLLQSVYDQYGINPEEIEYIVTHGTGTKLGDPIEVNALYDAFKGYTTKQGYCALTSTKTNFGHALAASGLVSLISLVQAFRHETIPASLHCEEENEYIHWPSSPFYVNKENKAWPDSGEKKRMGAVSAFGMSGTNVHMVLESYREEGREEDREFPCYLLALSAKTQEALQEKVVDMIAELKRRRHQGNLREISYTLLGGRQHFSHRCAVIAEDMEDGIYVLQQAGGREKLPNLFKGITVRDFIGQKAIKEYGQELLAQSSLAGENPQRYKEILQALAELYCQGYDLSWQELYRDRKPGCLHLPVYPFAREMYWAAKSGLQVISSPGRSVVTLHPLLHQNTSDFSEQRFTSTFTGEEFFLKDHVVRGQRVLPGVAYLEMARAAAEQAAGGLPEGRAGLRLRNVVWSQPLIVGRDGVRVHTGLYPQKNGEIAYEIYSRTEDSEEEVVVHSQGMIRFENAKEKIPNLNLPELQAECSLKTLSADQCYEQFRKIGLEYGAEYQTIETLYIGKNQVLAKLWLPSSVPDVQEQFIFHPGAMDSALQVVRLLQIAGNYTSSLAVTIQEVELFEDSVSTAWVLVCRGGIPGTFDMALCDGQGKISIRVKGLQIQEDAPEPDAGILSNEVKSSGDSLPIGRGRRAEMRGFTLEQCIEWDLKEQVSQLLKIPRDKLDREENLADFGFDSISLSELAGALTNHYGIEITPALFFGYSTLEKLTQYFFTVHQDVMQGYYRETVMQEMVQSVPVLSLSSKRQAKKSKLLRKHTVLTGQDQEPIAIIGMSGRFPDARNIEEMWQILAGGQDVIRDFPADRLSGKGKTPYKYGAVPGVSEFDPLFFEISPREAESMDPRQRLLLQESWKALEDAGYGTAKIQKSKIGMFVGVEEGDYRLLLKDKSSITANHNAVLSARLAYFLNLSGPNMAINTACSSGLVAVHQACQSIRSQECDTALAAGVNLLLTPEMFDGMQEAGMLSEDGKCFAFAKQANGMVPAEAVAVVVLKRLSQAKADKDPVYAVIRGSGINYDGKTNGITAPSGVSQTKLLQSVYDQYGINPEEIEYIVTHGTGTKLGDPIEVNALYDAFKGYTTKQGYCALTSTKTNFGHALAASGLVSLISLVQAFRHETIPASLHCEEENEYIHWPSSPFYVNKENKAWPENGEKKRMGAVSAFGMSGTNVHMVLESYREEGREEDREFPCYLLALSAKTQEALQEKIEEMIAELKRKQEQGHLGAVSYTLLAGRQHFSYRCAVVVQDREDAIYVLQQIDGKEKLPNLFKGIAARDFTGQKAIKEYGRELLAQSSSAEDNPERYKEILYALAELYCQGYDLSWEELYGERNPAGLHLPGYPFAKETYWAVESGLQVISSPGRNGRSAVALHPLLHQNTSDFSEQRFSSTFTGDEFFLKDHVVRGQRVLPGVAYLEMARAAAGQAAGGLLEERGGLRLRNVVWSRPLIVGRDGVQVHIGLFPEENGEISYKVYSSPGAREEAQVYSQGSVVFQPGDETQPLNLKEIQAQCNQAVLTAGDCYEQFRTIGLEYGTSHQGIETLYIGQGQVLAKLFLPLNRQEEFILHPGIMDSALQASNGLMLGSGGLKTALPFALQELEVIAPCTSSMWAVIRYSPDSKVEDRLKKLDIEVCNEQGAVCIRMKGFSARILETEKSAGIKDETGVLQYQFGWKEKRAALHPAAPVIDKHLVILCESSRIFEDRIAATMSGVRCLTLQSPKEKLAERFQDYAVQVLAEIQKIFQEKTNRKALLQIVVSPEKEELLLTGLYGLLQTAHLENSKLTGQVIEVDAGETPGTMIDKLAENCRNLADRRIRYRNGKRLVVNWSEIERGQEAADIPWKDQGVYLITGGAGGLGLIFAREIAGKTRNATLIITGRSVMNKEREGKLRAMESLGAKIEYRQVDVTDQKAVNLLVENIQKEYGGLHGILHCAGVIRDNFIIKKTQQELQEVLAPKVSGTLNLDQASKDLPLDFFILFSSLSGSLGNPGQADYAAANAFMDAYAEYRSHLADLKQRQGRTLSINWPLWKDGGMQLEKDLEEMMLNTKGMVALDTASGIQALYRSLAAGTNQVMVLEGKINQLRRGLSQGESGDKVEGGSVAGRNEDSYNDIFSEIIAGKLSEEEFEKVMLR